MIKSWFKLFAALVLLCAGCGTLATRTAKNRPLPPDWDSELGTGDAGVRPASDLATNRVPPATQNVTRPTIAVPVVPPPAITNNPVIGANDYIALSLWAKQNGYGSVKLLPLNPKPAYTVKTTAGSFTVQPDTVIAYWDRIEVRLGFAPKLSGEQIFVHALDVQKTLEPLSQGTAVMTPADRLVVIDPGHGGSNPGTRNIVTGRDEKDYTLDWARRSVPLLQKAGWRVLLTRTNDATISLAERVAFAEAHQATLFISLHFNASGSVNQEPAGVETYCLTPTGMASSVTRGYTDDADLKFPNNAFDDQNLRYAMRIQKALLEVNGGKDRGVRHARYQTVLQGQNRPAVLVEGGYLSNPTEARKIADANYRQQLAEAVAKALE